MYSNSFLTSDSNFELDFGLVFAVKLVTCVVVVVVVVVGNITSYNIAVNRYRSCCSCCCCWVRFSVQRGSFFFLNLFIFYLSVCLLWIKKFVGELLDRTQKTQNSKP